MNKKLNILILANNKKGVSTRHLVEAAEAKGHEVTLYDPYELYISCSDVNGHDKLFNKETRILQKSFDAIIPRVGGGLGYGSAIVRHLNSNMGIFSTATAQGLLTASDKLHTTQVLSKNRLQVPKTTYISQPSDFQFLVDTVGGLPCVCKLQKGSQGQGVFILETKLAGSTTLQSFKAIKTNLILQEYIETAASDEAKSDIRAYIVGGEVVASMKRYSLDSDFRSNYSISKTAEAVKLTDDEKQLCIDAAKVLNLGVCGVDLMRNVSNDKTYIIEVNGNASLNGITKITGVDVAGKIIEYIEKNHHKKDTNFQSFEPLPKWHKDNFKKPRQVV
jgi:ribosomal protein S6--L-glutamate ligase